MKTYEELAVLEQGDDGAIVSIRGRNGPYVLLGAKYLGYLASVLRSAEESLEPVRMSPEVGALTALCAEIRTLLKSYDETCVKYGGTIPSPRNLAEVERELEELRQQLLSI